MAAKKQPSVFEVYAHEYDLITNAAQRVKPHSKEVAALIKKFKPENVLDAGCASGLTALLFAEEGVEAVGLDRSRPMLKVANETRGKLRDNLSFCYGDFISLSKKLHNKFDLVVCLANSISGVGSTANLRKSLANFRAVLKPGGTLVLQMLNYLAIKEGVLFPIKATENKGIVYERFSERRGNQMFVYVTRLDLNQNPHKYEIFRHEFDNFEVGQVLKAFERVKFGDIKKYGDLLLSKRFTKSSRDLIVTARRPLA